MYVGAGAYWVCLMAWWVYMVGGRRWYCCGSGGAAANPLGTVSPPVSGCALCLMGIVPLEPVGALVPGKMWMA